METRDALDGQVTRDSTPETVGKTDLGVVHPLTGPVHVEGAEPGHLTHEYGYTRPQAYAICSVAVDLKVSELVDVPNFVVSAFLPLDLFV